MEAHLSHTTVSHFVFCRREGALVDASPFHNFAINVRLTEGTDADLEPMSIYALHNLHGLQIKSFKGGGSVGGLTFLQ